MQVDGSNTGTRLLDDGTELSITFNPNAGQSKTLPHPLKSQQYMN